MDRGGLEDALPALVEKARRAPSAHNTQPARWRARGMRLALLEDPTRRLAVGDPSGRDQQLALGAAWEAMHLALAARGMIWRAATLDAPRDEGAWRAVVEGGVESGIDPGAEPAPFAAALDARHCWRRPFAPAPRATLAALERHLAPMTCAVRTDAAVRDDAAELLDATTRALTADAPLYRELWDWMRLRDDDPRAARDGMHRRALGLSRLEAHVAQRLLHPRVVHALRSTGAPAVLMSERAPLASSSALVAFWAPRTEHALETGRRFLRAWLAIATAGLVACPMSALVDDARADAAMRRAFVVPSDAVLVQVWRVGALPQEGASDTSWHSARLPAHALIV